MEAASLEMFRKWLQVEIRDAEELESSSFKEQRLKHLESALQEAMAFEAAWELRKEAKTAFSKVETKVRLIAASPDSEITPMDTGVCSNCDSILTDDLEFCASCGKFQ